MSVREEVPALTLHILTDKGVPLVTPVVDQDLRRIKDVLFSQDDRTDGVSGLTLPICGLLIHRGAVELDGQDLDHWRGVVWDPGIVCLQCWLVCSDCHVWAEWSFWTEIPGVVRIYELVMVVTSGGCDDIRLTFEMVVYMFCAYVLLCIFCSQDFPRFASVCGVFLPMLLRGIVRSLLVF